MNGYLVIKNNYKGKDEKFIKMSKKILYCASTASHIINFHLPYLQYFNDIGWQVDVAVGSEVSIPFANNVFVLPFEKKLFGFNNIYAAYRIKRILSENSYDIISIHTTLAGAVIRLALLLSKKRSGKVVYTSHGYFFNGKGGLSEWPYLIVEKLLAPVTDLLMVMNQIDFNLATRYDLCKLIKPIQGMGLDFTKFDCVGNDYKKRLKEQSCFYIDDFLIVYAAEMSKRKNQGELIRAFLIVASQEPSMHLLLAGDGKLKEEYMSLAQKSGLAERIHFLGYVSDITNLYGMCDLAVSTSRSEGLPFNVMEAMACGLPIVASRIKGHIDLLGSLKVDCLYDLGDEKGLANLIKVYYLNKVKREQVGQANLRLIRHYDLEEIKPEIIELYSWLIKE